MARDKTIKFLRTTRANLNTQKAANNLLVGEPYLITDEARLAVGTANNDYVDFAKTTEASVGGSSKDSCLWHSFTSIYWNNADTQIGSFSFALKANTKYSVTLKPLQQYLVGVNSGSYGQIVFALPSGATISGLMKGAETPYTDILRYEKIDQSIQHFCLGSTAMDGVYHWNQLDGFIITGSTSGNVILKSYEFAYSGELRPFFCIMQEL